MAAPVTTPRQALFWVALGLCAAALYVSLPLVPVLILAAWIAALMRPLLDRFAAVLKGRRRAAATLSLLRFLFVVVPLVFVAISVSGGAAELMGTLSQTKGARGALDAIVSGSSDTAGFKIPSSPQEFIELAQQYGARTAGVLSSVFGAAARTFIGLFIFFGGAYVFLVDGAAIWAWLQRYSPLAPNHTVRMGAAFQETGRGLLIGVLLTSGTQGLLAAIAYLALDVPRALSLGLLTGVASLVPLVGSSLVWVPVSLGLWLNGYPGRAIVMAAIGVLVISMADNVLRPIYARYALLQLPTYVLFISLFGGLAAFGAWGALLGPLVVRLALEAVVLMKEPEVAVSLPPDGAPLP